MKIVRPTDITPEVVLSSNVPIAGNVWSNALSYTIGNSVVGNVPGTANMLFTSLQSPNLDHPPPIDGLDDAWWHVAGVANHRAAFDESPQTTTTNPESIAWIFGPPTRVDTLYMDSVDGTDVHVRVIDAIEGIVRDLVISMVAPIESSDWWEYFFGDPEYEHELVITNLPPYVGATIEVTINNPGAIAGCALCILGLSRSFGDTQYGASISIQDFSRKEPDEFGNYYVVKRAFSRRAGFEVAVESANVDRFVRILADYRATPIVYIGDDSYGSSVIYGFYKDFEFLIQYPTISILNIQVEGLAA